ncbi:SDR family oxidoreductase [Paenibacillus beijingensis]|uniref:Short-chain dehydrogenase n=1 Tax=Paenibacillus beijingensis TaxID=1126833 RepID=A0A0D5NKK4_9BACL|nr:SDR family oxidoreductase [Paenibacillus beijingensis]AJY75542.1 hypothetical protein VN24_14440 [Paenibacillus beijingensis]
MAQNEKGGAVFITGASGGIGFEAVRRLAGMDYRVFAGFRDPSYSKKLASIGKNVVPVQIDITDPVSVQSAAKTVTEALGPRGLSGLVNNAGTIVQGPLELLSIEEIKQQFDINVFGQIAVTQAFLPLLRKQSGRIVNIGAVTGKTAMPFIGALSASKHALEAVTDALRVELQPWNIQVSIIEPAAIGTNIFNKAAVTAKLSLDRVQADKRKLYDQAISTVNASFAKQPVSKTDVVVDAIVHALTANRPRTRYAVGRGARLVVLLSRFPDRIVDRLLSSSLGLTKASRPQSGSPVHSQATGKH